MIVNPRILEDSLDRVLENDSHGLSTEESHGTTLM